MDSQGIGKSTFDTIDKIERLEKLQFQKTVLNASKLISDFDYKLATNILVGSEARFRI